MAAKVAFIGTHGVGKTVLTFSLASRLRAMSLDADVAYENSRRSPFPINEATTLDGQMWILAAQWQAELEATRRTRLVICDRAVVDNYAYMVRACGEQKYLHPLLERWCRSYDALFWVPIVDEEVVADKVRSTSASFQREIHEIIASLVERFRLGNRVVALTRRREEHVPQVLETLRARKLVPPPQRLLFPELGEA